MPKLNSDPDDSVHVIIPINVHWESAVVHIPISLGERGFDPVPCRCEKNGCPCLRIPLDEILEGIDKGTDPADWWKCGDRRDDEA